MYNCTSGNTTILDACCPGPRTLGSVGIESTCAVANMSSYSYCVATYGTVVSCMDLQPAKVSGAPMLRIPGVVVVMVLVSLGSIWSAA